MAGMNEIVTVLDHLPPLPATAMRLIAMVDDPAATPDDLERIVRYDEALCSLILRLGNSAQMRRGKRTFDLCECIARLGRNHILRTALQQQVYGMFMNAGRSFQLNRGALWASAVGGALMAEELARRVHGVSSNEAFLGALLRDIGKIALDQHFGESYIQRLVDEANQHLTFSEIEQATFGFDHAQIGQALATRWKLPERLASVIGRHHQPPKPPDDDSLHDVVHAADVICLWAGVGVGRDGLRHHLEEHVREKLDLRRTIIEPLMAMLWQQLNELRATIGPKSICEELIA